MHPSIPGKIDQVVMERMFKEGKGPREIAGFFKCSHVSVINLHRKIQQRMAALPELIKESELQKDNLDTISQLGRINRTVMDELDRARRLIDREDKAVKEREQLEDKVKLFPKDTALVAELKEKAHINFTSILKIQSNVIDISAEVRKQLELQIKIAETLYNATMMAQFQEEVLNAIGRVSAPTREIIIKELRQLRTLRGLVQVKKL